MSLGPPWDTFGPRPQKNQNIIKNVFLSHFGDLFSSGFLYFHCSFNLRLGNPPDHFLKDFGVILSQFLEQFSKVFEETENLEKCNPYNAKPLFLSIQRQGFSSFFQAFFKRGSRISILSIFDRILIILGTFLRSGSKGVPGWSQGSSQGPSRVKIAPQWV